MKIHLQSKVEDVSEGDICDITDEGAVAVEPELKNATMDKLNSKMTKLAWIGLYRDKEQKWRWTGEELATNIQTWADGEPLDNETFAATYWHCDRKGWHGVRSDREIPFFCFNLMVDDVKKTWEEALEHCRETHTDLTSLNSETEQRLALSEIQHDHITERVWIGLRFFGDRWLWVNGDPLVYEAWPEGDQEHQCPLRKRCGALTKEGHWENWDCVEKLHFICY
uniref:C-type lectin domain-containing protein n=1 Tax=Labrus bergylta TaxID=56723 RepID=A0A3Q3FA96_9LABR